MSAPAAGRGADSPPTGGLVLRTKRCGVCGRSYDPDAWRALPSLAVLPPATVRPHLSVAAEWAVDLRSCHCGAVLAARRQ